VEAELVELELIDESRSVELEVALIVSNLKIDKTLS
jgi:hypothetical protein